jgi:hypothetical protein
VRQRIARFLVKVPGFRGLYAKALVRSLERTPPSKLPPELRQLKTMLDQLPADQRVELLKNAAKGNVPQPEQMSRSMRREAERQARRKR